jgi:integral membrane sensor domain MASE1
MKPFEHRIRFPMWSDRVNRWAITAAIAVIYYGAARLALLLAFESTNASPIWPPTGIAFAAVLLFGFRIWPAITLGAFAANFAVFASNHVAASGLTTASVSLAIAIGNTLEAVIGALLLRAVIRSGDPFDHPANIFKLSATVLVMCSISAVVGTVSLINGGLAPVGARGNIMLSWWLGDVGGALIVMPALLCWLSLRRNRRPQRSRLGIAASLTGLVLIATLVFSGRFFPLSVARLLLALCFPCVAWAAYRFGQRGATLTSLLFAAIAVVSTVHGVGPFTAGPLNDSLILLVCLPVSWDCCSVRIWWSAMASASARRAGANSRRHGWRC